MRKSEIKRVLLITFILLLIAFFYRYFSKLPKVAEVEHDSSEIEIHMIDVGQSESILIIQGDNTMLIDTGEMLEGKVVSEYLAKQGIRTIDVLIITHFHKDHMGGAHRVVTSFDVNKIVCMDKKYISTLQELVWYADLSVAQHVSEIFHKIEIDFETPYDENGELKEFSLGDAEITFLSQNNADKVNNKSVITRLEFGEFSALFMSDAEKELEQELIDREVNLSADVLKVSHHGSNTSSIQEFLEQVNPQYALISCGLNNNYFHPHKEVLHRLDDIGISKVYRTDLNGNIVVKSDGKGNIEIVTEK